MMMRISELIHQAQPLTAATSLIPSSTSPHTTHNNTSNSPANPNPYPDILKSLISPFPLIGTLTLPSFPTNSTSTSCTCFRFSDGTATLCCYVLDGVHPTMVGQKVRLLAWNFIPMKCGKDGFLEIIKWDFAVPIAPNSCSFSRLSLFCCTSGVCRTDSDRKAKSFVFGVVESVSPVSVVPCSSRESNAVNLSGFLVNVRVCECKLCSSKSFVSEFGKLKEENVGDHCFDKTVIVYFCGLTSSWHPIVSTLIGKVVFISSLKKKLVFIGKDQPQLMYVPGDSVSLHVIKMFKKQNGVCYDGSGGNGRCGSYTGVITGIYMQGMVVELDQDVMLVVTDQYLCVPHCMRVGAIVTLKNVHFVDPKFLWGKMLILGACCHTSMFVVSFSPLKTGYYCRSYPPSLLQKFIDSLPFSARLWVLVFISSFKRKFVSCFSDTEILGSQHKEGMAQKYAGSYLPSSAFRLRHGVLSEFCKHDSCSDVEDGQYRLLKLVLPIANLISYCDTSWKRSLNDSLHNLDFVGDVDHRKPLFCDGRFYEQSTRRVLRTEEIGVLVLGTLKISTSSGRLQLVDSTGGVDIMLDLPPTWNFNKIFEAKNFVIVMEGIQWKLADLNTTTDQPISCRSIFSNAPLLKRPATSLYLYHDPRDENTLSDSLFFDSSIVSKELGCGIYHLLMLTHKFPFKKKLHGYQTNRSFILAEAIVLPFNLLITSKHEDAVLTRCQRKNSLHDLTNHKRRKIDQVHLEISDNDSADARNGLSDNSSCSFSFDRKSYSTSSGLLEIPCMISSKGLPSHSRGILQCTSKCKPPSKVLLEFGPDSFCKYTVLEVGCCYLLDYQESLLSTMGRHKFEGSKLFISSNTNLRFLNFSSTDGLESSDVPNTFSFPELCPNIGNGISEGFEHPILTRENTRPNKSYLGVNVFVATASLNIILNNIKILNNDPFELKDSLKEESDICARHGARITSVMQSSGPSCIDYSLPVGNLITLNGVVVGLHDCDGDAFRGQSRLVPDKGSLPMFLQGNGGICVHLLVEDCTVMIFCDLSKQAHPVGLGQDVCATFHRILVLSGMNKYMMLPVSSITINNVCLVKRHTDAESCTTLASLAVDRVAFPNTDAAELIYDVLGSALLESRQFRCRVVAVYLLEVVSSRHAKVLQSSGQTQLTSFGIPLAGFIMDDGSSTFCCWSESEKAATLLGLNFEGHAIRPSPDNIGNGKTGKGLGYGSRVSHLNQILERHGRLVVKNYGSIVDSSCQDLAFSFGSDKSISISSEDILMSLVISSLGTFWCVTGSVMEKEGSRWLANRLSEGGMALPSSVQNVWATSVRRTDVLSEARIMLQEVAIE